MLDELIALSDKLLKGMKATPGAYIHADRGTMEALALGVKRLAEERYSSGFSVAFELRYEGIKAAYLSLDMERYGDLMDHVRDFCTEPEKTELMTRLHALDQRTKAPYQPGDRVEVKYGNSAFSRAVVVRQAPASRFFYYLHFSNETAECPDPFSIHELRKLDTALA